MPKLTILPEGFQELDVWVEGWAQSTETKRRNKRVNSTFPELQAFYKAVQPFLTKILEHCDQFEVRKCPKESAQLFDLALMLSEIAPSVERYKQVGVPYSFPEERFVSAQGDVEH